MSTPSSFQVTCLDRSFFTGQAKTAKVTLKKLEQEDDWSMDFRQR
jgi:hypothetical protein